MPRLVLAATLCLAGLPAHADAPRVTLKIGFDPAAAKALADMGEMVTVSSHFFALDLTAAISSLRLSFPKASSARSAR